MLAAVMTPRCLVLIAFLMCGCGKAKAPPPSEADCAAACVHVLDLTMADIDQSAKATNDPALAKITTELKAKALTARESDLKACATQCLAGKLGTRCALAATTLDEAMTCSNLNGGLH